MNRRMKSMKLMKYLRIFIQNDLVDAQTAQDYVEQYVIGNDKPLLDFICSDSLPVYCLSYVDTIVSLIKEENKNAE